MIPYKFQVLPTHCFAATTTTSTSALSSTAVTIQPNSLWFLRPCKLEIRSSKLVLKKRTIMRCSLGCECTPHSLKKKTKRWIYWEIRYFKATQCTTPNKQIVRKNSFVFIGTQPLKVWKPIIQFTWTTKSSLWFACYFILKALRVLADVANAAVSLVTIKIKI